MCLDKDEVFWKKFTVSLRNSETGLICLRISEENFRNTVVFVFVFWGFFFVFSKNTGESNAE